MKSGAVVEAVMRVEEEAGGESKTSPLHSSVIPSTSAALAAVVGCNVVVGRRWSDLDTRATPLMKETGGICSLSLSICLYLSLYICIK
jgi:hypothetical protein